MGSFLPVSCCRAAALLVFFALTPSHLSLLAQASSAAEARTTQAFEEARHEGPPATRAFLVRMPKGGDLHMHLSGAVYAETFIREAAEDNLCVNPALLAIDPRNHAAGCPAGESPASSVPSNQHLYDELIDAFSMRAFVPVTGDSGHDHFFAAFGRFGNDDRFTPEWIDEVASRAAAQNEQYLEIMQSGNYRSVTSLADSLGWNPDFAAFRRKLLADPVFRQAVQSNRSDFAAALRRREQLEHCRQANAASACSVAVRFLYQVLRGLPPQDVFAQTLLGFELASTDPDVVGINFVMPEDGYIALRDYALQMHMLDYLHRIYPHVHIALHAGELAEGMVQPQDLTFHIRMAVELGHAERIGHGVDIMFEDRPWQLMEEMAARHVDVEINLTSNDVILNVRGSDHPFMLYRRAAVPVTLSTDDEGVSRIDLTHEYVRAADTYALTYHDLKLMARASIEHSFLSGPSLWEQHTPERLETPVPACRDQIGSEQPSGLCATLVHSSQKAQQEWDLEHRFHTFETSF